MAADNPSGGEGVLPVTTVSTADLTPGLPADPSPPSSVAEPAGAAASPPAGPFGGAKPDQHAETGVDGEEIVWEARYSKRNFIGRITSRIALTLAWAALAVYTWGYGHENIDKLTWLVMAALVLYWIALVVRIIQAHYSHYYRLTNRRLFLSTGIVHRRRDMMELLKVKDVFTRQQSLFDRWLSLGTVVVVPDGKDMPTFYLTGVDGPKEVMDLIWHQSRTERANKSVMIDHV